MRGQRLFVRPIEASDHEAVHTFLAQHGRDGSVPAYGLLGKLVGELVAVVALDITSDAVRITEVVVATDLRRKRIGRAMLGEAAQIAAKMDRSRLVVDDAAGAEEFFRRVGFHEEAGVWIRNLSGVRRP